MIIYLLPKKDYFSKGRRGSVTHALGVSSGLINNREKVHLVSGVGLEQYVKELGNDAYFTEVKYKGPDLFGIVWLIKYLSATKRILKNYDKNTVVIYRYAVSKALFIKLLQ